MPLRPPYDPEAHLPDDFEYTGSPVGTPAEEVARAKRKLTGLMTRAQKATGVDAARLGAQAAFLIDDIEKRGIAVEMTTDADHNDIMDSDEIIPVSVSMSDQKIDQARVRMDVQGYRDESAGEGDMLDEAFARVWHPFRPDCVRGRHSHWPREWSYEGTKKIQERYAHD